MSAEALKLALEFIERTSTYLPTTFDSEGLNIHSTIKAAIAAPVQGPVAYAVFHQLGGSKTLHWPENHSEDGDANDYILVPLYAAPLAQQEPMAWMHVAANMPSNRHLEWNENHPGYRGDWIKHPLYTTPPAAPVQDELAYREAVSLATWLFKKHFAHEEHYASGRVVWEPCDTTAGVISQIDNMVAGLEYDLPAAQREWVGLADEEIQNCYRESYETVQGRQLEILFARTIEAKLKEKNHG